LPASKGTRAGGTVVLFHTPYLYTPIEQTTSTLRHRYEGLHFHPSLSNGSPVSIKPWSINHSVVYSLRTAQVKPIQQCHPPAVAVAIHISRNARSLSRAQISVASTRELCCNRRFLAPRTVDFPFKAFGYLYGAVTLSIYPTTRRVRHI